MTSVNLYDIIAAAKHDPGAAQGATNGHATEVKVVEQALAQQGLLRQGYVDGSYGSLTITAYSNWQKSLGYTGTNADGIPGLDSLTKLGKKWGFVVSTGTSTTPAPTGGQISIGSVQYLRYSPGATSSVSAAVAAICKLTGRADNGWTAGYEVACLRESSRIPSSINNYDSNATGPTVADGFPLHCSRGIAQCIPDTFATYHQSGTSLNIYDTIANIAASMNYVIHVYGVFSDGSNLAQRVQQFDPNRPSKGY